MFTSIIDSVNGVTLESALICSVASVVLGLLISVVYYMSTRCSKNFAISLAVLPILVQIVIMMVNGNLGTSVAILGAFSLVRFRSEAGNSKQIVSVFFAMAIGLATGMGCVGFAVLFTVIVGVLLLVLSKSSFGTSKTEVRDLKITIPETLDYNDVFDDIFDKYLVSSSLEQVKTTNMGSMYELTYHVVQKDITKEKEMIDEIRCRNGNLTVVSRRQREDKNEL